MMSDCTNAMKREGLVYTSTTAGSNFDDPTDLYTLTILAARQTTRTTQPYIANTCALRRNLLRWPSLWSEEKSIPGSCCISKVSAFLAEKLMPLTIKEMEVDPTLPTNPRIRPRSSTQSAIINVDTSIRPVRMQSFSLDISSCAGGRAAV